MAESNPGKLLVEDDGDPYLALNAQVEAALSGIEDIKEKIDGGFDPSVQKAVLAALKVLTEVVGNIAKMATPVIKLDPSITVQPAISVKADTPKSWVIEVMERDAETGKPKKMRISAD